MALGSILPNWLRSMLARLLPWLELLAAAGLLLSVRIPWLVLPAVFLLALYAGVLAISVRRGAAIEDCGCHFGGRRQVPSIALVWRNLLLLLPAVSLMTPMLDRQLVWFVVITVAGLLLSGVVIYLLANLLIANRTSLQELNYP
jgi:hypothetical protein